MQMFLTVPVALIANPAFQGKVFKSFCGSEALWSCPSNLNRHSQSLQWRNTASRNHKSRGLQMRSWTTNKVFLHPFSLQVLNLLMAEPMVLLILMYLQSKCTMLHMQLAGLEVTYFFLRSMVPKTQRAALSPALALKMTTFNHIWQKKSQYCSQHEDSMRRYMFVKQTAYNWIWSQGRDYN